MLDETSISVQRTSRPVLFQDLSIPPCRVHGADRFGVVLRAGIHRGAMTEKLQVDTRITVETPEGVDFEFRLAGPWQAGHRHVDRFDFQDRRGFWR